MSSVAQERRGMLFDEDTTTKSKEARMVSKLTKDPTTL